MRTFSKAVLTFALSFCVAALPATAAAAPALWAVSKGRATVYLFGTSHAGLADPTWRTPEMEAALKASRQLWLEMQATDDPAAGAQLVRTFGMDPARTLQSRLDAAQNEKLAAVLARYGLAPAMVAPMKPWLAGLTVSMLPLRKAGLDPRFGADVVLRDAMKAAGKPVDGFDTRERQLRYLADLPETDQIAFLMDSLDRAGDPRDLPRRVAEAWQKGDLAALEALLNAEVKQRSPLLYARLVVDRNRTYAARIAQMLEGKDDQFVAVGVGHLVGPESIEAILAAKGAKVRRLR